MKIKGLNSLDGGMMMSALENEDLMVRLDHFVVHVDNDLDKLRNLRDEIVPKGFPYEPEQGKGTAGFKASNIFIGKQYFEIVRLLDSEGGGWQAEWVEKYNRGHRGIICIFIAVNDIWKLQKQLDQSGVGFHGPVRLVIEEGGLEIPMPFQLLFTQPLEGTDLEIAFIQYDPGVEEQMAPPVEYNAETNGITGICEARIFLPQMDNNLDLFKKLFPHLQEVNEEFVAEFNNQRIILAPSDVLEVVFKATCENQRYLDKSFTFLNVRVDTVTAAK